MNQIAKTSHTTSISQQTVRDRELSILVASFGNKVALEKDGTWWLEQLPTTEQRRGIVERQSSINRTLQAASMSDADKTRIARAVAQALAGWVNAKSSNPEASVAGYVLHLQDLPAFAVEKACERVGRGQVEGLSPDFPPSAARLHQLAKEEIEALTTEAITIARVLRAKLQPPRKPEDDARLRALTTAWLDRSDPDAQRLLQATKHNPVPFNPYTDDQLRQMYAPKPATDSEMSHGKHEDA